MITSLSDGCTVSSVPRSSVSFLSLLILVFHCDRGVDGIGRRHSVSGQDWLTWSSGDCRLLRGEHFQSVHALSPALPELLFNWCPVMFVTRASTGPGFLPWDCGGCFIAGMLLLAPCDRTKRSLLFPYTSALRKLSHAVQHPMRLRGRSGAPTGRPFPHPCPLSGEPTPLGRAMHVLGRAGQPMEGRPLLA